MNNERRKRLTEIATKLEDAKADLESLCDEEQEAFDSMPEGLRAGEKGQKVEAALAAINETVDNLDGAIANIETAGE